VSWLRSIGVLSLCAFMLAGCRHQGLHVKVERIKAEYRGTAEWNISKAAFKRIMREYVHGDTSISDAQLDRDFEAYVSLSSDDVNEFLATQTCLPQAEAGDDRFYMANATHQRHDAFFAPNQPARAISGSGTKHAHARFTANLLLERTSISQGAEFPPRAKTKGNPFSNWDALRQALQNETKFNQLFLFKEPAQGQEVFDVTRALDFSKVTGEVFMAPTLKNGDVFSPALFAVYILRSDANASPSVYAVISANAQGAPETPYVGLIDPTKDPFQSETGFAFTYLSTPKNLLSYSLVLKDESPLAFDVWITTAYPNHPEKPYLTVRSTFVPAVSQKAVAKYRDSQLTRLILMIRKGALMRDLVRLYYPNSSEVQLWNDVGAIHGTRFRNKLEAAGLNVAADLFDRDLWLEKPKVGATAPLEFKVAPDAPERCSAE
jgi:hypothetical protein